MHSKNQKLMMYNPQREHETAFPLKAVPSCSNYKSVSRLFLLPRKQRGTICAQGRKRSFRLGAGPLRLVTRLPL